MLKVSEESFKVQAQTRKAPGSLGVFLVRRYFNRPGIAQRNGIRHPTILFPIAGFLLPLLVPRLFTATTAVETRESPGVSVL